MNAAIVAGISPAAGTYTAQIVLTQQVSATAMTGPVILNVSPPQSRTTMPTPIPGLTFSGSSVTFNWNAGTGETAYWLDVS